MPVFETTLGNSVRLDVTVTAPAGTPESPAGIHLIIESPSGEEFENELNIEMSIGEGRAWCIYRPSEVGTYLYSWWFEGEPGGYIEGIFKVRDTMLKRDG